MKRSIAILVPALLSPVLCGCEPVLTSKSSAPRIADKTVKIENAEATAGNEARIKRDEYVRAMNQELAALEVKYEDLKVRASQAEGQAKVDLDRRVEEARLKHADAAKKLDELKAAGVDGWEKVKDGLGKSFDDLKRIFE